MTMTEISLNDLITICLIIAQAGVVYYRVKKVEQRMEELNNLLVEFAVHKNSLKHYRDQYEKQSTSIEFLVQKLHDRISGLESKAFDIFAKP